MNQIYLECYRAKEGNWEAIARFDSLAKYEVDWIATAMQEDEDGTLEFRSRAESEMSDVEAVRARKEWEEFESRFHNLCEIASVPLDDEQLGLSGIDGMDYNDFMSRCQVSVATFRRVARTSLGVR